jgi:hypothetical protein
MIDRDRFAAACGRGHNTQEPVAWLAHSDEWQMVSMHRGNADAAAAENGAEVVPLYRTPQTALTDEEREALRKVLRRVREDYFAGRFADSVEVAAVIDGLLERTN